MNVSIGNWDANKLSYKILGKLIEILEKINNKLDHTLCVNLVNLILYIKAKHFLAIEDVATNKKKAHLKICHVYN